MVALVAVSAAALPVNTAWGPTNFDTNMIGIATATVSLFSTTSDGGIIDIALRNTSPLIHIGTTYENAFGGTLEINVPAGFSLDKANSSVETLAADSVRFSNGAGNPVVTNALDKLLNWGYGTPGGGGPHLAYEATNKANKNTIWSSNALVGGIPQDNVEDGMLKAAYTGAVFDVVHFYLKVNNGSRSLMASDLNMYSSGNLNIHWQGGGGSIWDTNHASGPSIPNTGIPEPSTLLVMLCALPGVAAWVIRKKMHN
jgi:hypothetical protein